jgi:hypothetical protein
MGLFLPVGSNPKSCRSAVADLTFEGWLRVRPA